MWGKARILARLAGDAGPLRAGLPPVLRPRDGLSVYVLLCGGDKGSQKRDIAKAKEMARAPKKGGA